jgi:hypothetical protein
MTNIRWLNFYIILNYKIKINITFYIRDPVKLLEMILILSDNFFIV